MADGFHLDLLTTAERDTVESGRDDLGFLTRFKEWAGKKTDAPDYSLLSSGLMALSMAAGDTVAIEPLFGSDPVYMNLYTLLVGPSTVMRKTTVLNFVRGLLPKNQATEQDYMTWMDDTSIQAFNKALADAGKTMSPVCLSVDEVAGLFQQVRNRSGSYLTGFDKALLKAYDHTPVSIHRVANKVDVPHGAFVNIYAASTPEPLMEVLGSEDVESGLLPRFIVFDVREANRGHRRTLMERKKLTDEFDADAEALRAFLLDIAIDRASGIPKGTDRDGNPRFHQTILSFTPDAMERLDTIDDRFSKEASRDSTAWGAIKGRAFWHIVKLSGLYALSRAGRKTDIEVIDVLRAIHLVEATVADLGKMQYEVGANAQERRVNEVLDLLKGTRTGQMKASAIARQMKLSGSDMKDLANTLLVRELIVVLPGETGKKDLYTGFWKAT